MRCQCTQAGKGVWQLPVDRNDDAGAWQIRGRDCEWREWHVVGTVQACRGLRGRSQVHHKPIEGRAPATAAQAGDAASREEIGRAHVWTPVTNAQLLCRPLLDDNKTKKQRNTPPAST